MEVIKCSYTELVSVKDLKPYKSNPNTHPKEQIQLLAEIIEFQGQRHPIIVSNLSGEIVAGNGRLEAFKLLGWDKIAVDYQDFDDDDQEYAFVVSDNASTEQSILDFKLINKKLPELHLPKIELLGLKGFKFEPLEKPLKNPLIKILECPECKAHFEQKQAKVVS